jgi:peptidyl-prolyl cis-trans isomerase C
MVLFYDGEWRKRRVMKGRAMRVAGWVLAAVGLLVLFGCGEKNLEKAPGSEPETKADSEVVALIGREEITKQDLDAAMEGVPEARQAVLRDRMLDSLIEARVFSEEARKAGLDKGNDVQRDLERAKKEILARAFIKRYVDKEAEPSEEELRKYYDAHNDEFVVPDGVLIQEIVTKTKEKAEEAFKALQEQTASFDQVAGKYSTARTWDKGGRRGWIYKGKEDPDLEKVAFGLAKDAVSDIFQTKAGYHIIKVLDKMDEYLMSFEDAKGRMGIRFAGQRRNELIHKYYQEAKVDKKPSEPGVLVKIGEESIPESYLVPILGAVPVDDKLRQRWIQYLVDTTVFSREAEKVALEKDPEVARELKRREDSLLAQAFRKQVIGAKTQIDDKEISQYYETHPEEFKVPEKVRVQAILVKTKEEAEKALKDLETSPSFAWVAVNTSLHPDAKSTGGDIGWFSRGEKDPALENAAFSLEKGQVSGIIQTQAGFEIIKVMDKKGGYAKPLEEDVKQQIKMTLMGQKLEEQKKIYFEQAKVKITGR